MVDRLRLFWNRPLHDGDRLRLFTIAVALIAGAAGALTQLDRPAPQRPAPHRDTERTTAAPSVEAPANPGLTTAPAEEGSRTTVAVSQADVAASKRAARRFLAGYLPYTYGRRPVRRIDNATPALRRRLEAQRPRVPGAERRRTPRLDLLQSDSVGRDRAELVVVVDDGKRRYTVPLELTRARAGWQVARAGS